VLDSAKVRRIVSRVSRIEGAPTTDEWDTLGLPVGLAAIMLDSRRSDLITVLYPGAAGVVQGSVAKSAWQSLVGAHPTLAALEPDVEAILAHTLEGQLTLYRVGVDTCFRLAAILRSGSLGSADARVRTFFTELA
jgi:uncharacterized protein DUF5947